MSRPSRNLKGSRTSQSTPKHFRAISLPPLDWSEVMEKHKSQRNASQTIDYGTSHTPMLTMTPTVSTDIRENRFFISADAGSYPYASEARSSSVALPQKPRVQQVYRPKRNGTARLMGSKLTSQLDEISMQMNLLLATKNCTPVSTTFVALLTQLETIHAKKPCEVCKVLLNFAGNLTDMYKLLEHQLEIALKGATFSTTKTRSRGAQTDPYDVSNLSATDEYFIDFKLNSDAPPAEYEEVRMALQDALKRESSMAPDLLQKLYYSVNASSKKLAAISKLETQAADLKGIDHLLDQQVALRNVTTIQQKTVKKAIRKFFYKPRTDQTTQTDAPTAGPVAQPTDPETEPWKERAKVLEVQLRLLERDKHEVDIAIAAAKTEKDRFYSTIARLESERDALLTVESTQNQQISELQAKLRNSEASYEALNTSHQPMLKKMAAIQTHADRLEFTNSELHKTIEAKKGDVVALQIKLDQLQKHLVKTNAVMEKSMAEFGQEPTSPGLAMNLRTTRTMSDIPRGSGPLSSRTFTKSTFSQKINEFVPQAGEQLPAKTSITPIEEEEGSEETKAGYGRVRQLRSHTMQPSSGVTGELGITPHFQQHDSTASSTGSGTPTPEPAYSARAISHLSATSTSRQGSVMDLADIPEEDQTPVSPSQKLVFSGSPSPIRGSQKAPEPTHEQIEYTHQHKSDTQNGGTVASQTAVRPKQEDKVVKRRPQPTEGIIKPSKIEPSEVPSGATEYLATDKQRTLVSKGPNGENRMKMHLPTPSEEIPVHTTPPIVEEAIEELPPPPPAKFTRSPNSGLGLNGDVFYSNEGSFVAKSSVKLN